MSTSTHHLRPVSDFSHSPSTTASTMSPSDHSPRHRTRPSPRQARRPLTPSSLRDVDLTQASDSLPRNPNYPTPPTGHDLMAMFPPAPPDNIPEMRPGPTSGFFQRQERAFFAQAGKEIVRVCVDVDVAHPTEDSVKSRIGNSTRSWSTAPGPSGTTSLQSSVQGSPGPYPHPSLRPRVNVNPATFPVASHSPPSLTQNPHPPHHHPTSSGIRTPPQDIMSLGPPIQKPEFPPDDFPTDESWRRPMPYAERRRAGKHTRRVLRT